MNYWSTFYREVVKVAARTICCSETISFNRFNKVDVRSRVVTDLIWKQVQNNLANHKIVVCNFFARNFRFNLYQSNEADSEPYLDKNQHLQLGPKFRNLFHLKHAENGARIYMKFIQNGMIFISFTSVCVDGVNSHSICWMKSTFFRILVTGIQLEIKTSCVQTC